MYGNHQRLIQRHDPYPRRIAVSGVSASDSFQLTKSASEASEHGKKTRSTKPKNDFEGSLEHRGGKKLGQHGTEFFHKVREARKHPTRGYRGKKG